MLVHALKDLQSFSLNCDQFFVSYHGVIVLAFDRFPDQVISAKQKIHEECKALKPENSGSKWPKITLGCLKEGKRLSLEQLAILKRITVHFCDLLRLYRWKIEKLSIVGFQCRSLERLLFRFDVPLLDQSPDYIEGIGNREFVKNVLQEFDLHRIEEYWFNASKDGQREMHYRSDHVENTLVAFLDKDQDQLYRVIEEFINLVDKELPGMYVWFDRKSLHLTIRALS
jgi:hypothetical protein